MFAMLIYMLFGLALAWRVLPSWRVAVKCWLGLVFGCVGLMWLPCLAAFIWGFTKTAQDNALGLAVAATIGLCVIKTRPSEALAKLKQAPPLPTEDLVGLLVSLFATAFAAYLLHTHG